jgi:hypothetical protein
MRTVLLWHQWRGLHQIYDKGFSTNKIKNIPYIDHLINQGLLKISSKNPDRILSIGEFRSYYEERLLEKYNRYCTFLTDYDLSSSNSKYTEDDIGTLMLIKENQEGIKNSKQTRRGLSAELFQDSKYIEEHPGLEKAILKLIGLESFPGQDPKDNQYIFVTPCKTREAIILCENLHFLRVPWEAREHNIELWYVGGNNVSKLEHLPQIEPPIYYSCDWDYAGLSIYQRIRIYIPTIKLLYPAATSSAKPIDTQNHRSQWQPNLPLSALEASIYSEKEKALINNLIQDNQWIEEESNSFCELIGINALGKSAGELTQ